MPPDLPIHQYMFLGPAKKSPKAPRKSGRSTSPRAVELRRLHNRISQRKHRSKVRQARENAEGEFTSTQQAAEEPPDSPQHATAEASATSTIGHIVVPSPTSTSPRPGAMIMAEDLLQCDPPWQHVDSLLSLPAENDSTVSQQGFTLQSFKVMHCTCNSTDGPCSSHLEILRAQIMVESNSSLPPMPPPLSSTLSSPYSRSMMPLGDSAFASSMSADTSPPSDLPPATSEPSSAKARLRAPSTSSTADMTPRFSMVLEAIRQAGFQDFEEVAVAYYTSRFEWGSVPAMVQCVSRSHRLKAMLHELQQSSRQWPRWESRGLHESVSEAAVSLCVDDMERVSQAPGVSPSQSETANLISALEWLLRDQGCNSQSYSRTTGESSLSEQVEAGPDSMPHLWSLLTELAGAQGLYCGRIARILLAIILFARRAQ
ncbi:hypothetical protein BU26DRAFT_611024 [Trematosphaeria pertusa]|uniref:BZIP domain-containing protein n=1 Tax=Trematosphaeria pertusa TaxID=390896 RepID=A0A6A6HT31_9PLEO|nr:uncharacterized protein BU26DRAFT_611024 [Trematosphaeria pertusa]KAF2241171.1 hypothetical protein BU26DRAFT_611024 [Trematosphaeria pertusa]